jgi:type II secretion system protein N
MSESAPAPSPGRFDELELPRSVRRIWIPLGCVLLTLFFFLRGFPYDRIGEIASARIAASTGTRIAIRSLAPSLGLLGPGVRAEGVSTTLPDGTALVLDVARVRPAWSLSWLRGRPALAVDLEGPLGRAVGTLTLGPEPAFEGQLRDVELARLPVASFLPGGSADGKADVDTDVRSTPAGARGRIQIDARDGSLALPNLPLALPFAKLHAELELTDTEFARIGAFDLDGPLLAARATGQINRAPYLAAAGLQLELRIEAKDPSLRPLLTQAGLPVGPDGSAQVRVLGSVGQPIVR